MIYVGQWDGASHVQTALVLLLESYVGRLFVDADAEPFELRLYNLFVCQGLVDVEHNKNQMTSFGHSDDLSSTTFAVFGTLDDTGQIEHLDFSTIVKNLSRNSRELALWSVMCGYE